MLEALTSPFIEINIRMLSRQHIGISARGLLSISIGRCWLRAAAGSLLAVITQTLVYIEAILAIDNQDVCFQSAELNKIV